MRTRCFLLGLTLVSAVLCTPMAARSQSLTLAPAVAADVHESYQLLVTTSYQPVNPQLLMNAARDALLHQARQDRTRLRLPELLAGSDLDTTVARLDQAIEDSAAASHASPTPYAYAAITGMANAMHDRWTEFMTPDMFREFNQELDPSSVPGIGVMIEVDRDTHFIRVSYVLPETPADAAGIVPGDELLSIGGTPTKNLSSDAASALLRGKAGEAVDLLVWSPQNSVKRQLDIVRANIQPPTVLFSMLPHHIGYVHVLDFGLTTDSEFDTAVARLQDRGMRALALDLRDDGGGYVLTALQISSRLIAGKPIVTVEDRDSEPQTMDAQSGSVLSVPLVVLVNDDTASASEITAGALQDDGVGTLVGTKTFGKGVMQTLTQLPDGAAIKITTAHYLTPNNHDINLRGILPNVRVAENKHPEFGEISNDAQLRAAIELLQKKIAVVTHR